jgi:homoserine O-acetyltransferase/O-succinyltransferase
VTLLLFTALCSAQDARQQFASQGDLKLERGETILDCRIGYRTFGRLNADRSNIVLMSTWFTGGTSEMTGLFGEDKLIDTAKYWASALVCQVDQSRSAGTSQRVRPDAQQLRSRQSEFSRRRVSGA